MLANAGYSGNIFNTQFSTIRSLSVRFPTDAFTVLTRTDLQPLSRFSFSLLSDVVCIFFSHILMNHFKELVIFHILYLSCPLVKLFVLIVWLVGCVRCCSRSLGLWHVPNVVIFLSYDRPPPRHRTHSLLGYTYEDIKKKDHEKLLFLLSIQPASQTRR